MVLAERGEPAADQAVTGWILLGIGVWLLLLVFALRWVGANGPDEDER